MSEFSHTYRASDVIKVFYSPTDAQVNCLKTNLKFTLKLTLQKLLHVSVQSPSSGSALFELVKVVWLQPHHRINHTDVF
jgi:hypothetical protein